MRNKLLTMLVIVGLFSSSFTSVVCGTDEKAEPWQIGVIARIDEHGTGLKLDSAIKANVPIIQLAAPFKDARTKKNADQILETLAKNKMTISSVIAGFDDESYESIPIVKETVGLVPKKTRAERMIEFKEISDFAKLLNAPAIMFHLGFVPHDRNSAEYKDIVRLMKEICDYVEKNGQAIYLETGQETAEALSMFIKDVDRANLFINFDPANMILYGCGDPIGALEILGQYVRSVHCKDALWAGNPGEEWGKEVLFGTGDVHAKIFMDTLKKIEFDGPLIIERENHESPHHQFDDVTKTIGFLKVLRENVL